jgi:hypothetical protein
MAAVHGRPLAALAIIRRKEGRRKPAFPQAAARSIAPAVARTAAVIVVIVVIVAVIIVIIVVIVVIFVTVVATVAVIVIVVVAVIIVVVAVIIVPDLAAAQEVAVALPDLHAGPAGIVARRLGLGLEHRAGGLVDDDLDLVGTADSLDLDLGRAFLDLYEGIAGGDVAVGDSPGGDLGKGRGAQPEDQDAGGGRGKEHAFHGSEFSVGDRLPAADGRDGAMSAMTGP